MQEVSITTEGIQKNLKNFKPLDALCEYIWNGFDAQADRVDVKLHTNEFGLINMISIVDNGTGIAYEELGDKFKPFNDSKKYDSSKKVNHTLPHGRQGIGRLTFFAFAQRARWNTVYEKDGNKYEYYIDMEKDSLNQYDDNGGRTPKTTEKDVGTEVIFTQIQQFLKEDIVERIKTEFFWFLELNKNRNFQILVDGEKVTYDDFIINKIAFVPEAELANEYEISIVQWNQSLGKEFSKFYFIDSDNEEKYKEATKLNKKSDEFFHSIFIKSSYFDNFYFEKEMDGQACLFPNKNEPEYRNLMDSINNFLYKFRRQYLKEASDKFIDKLIDSKIYPEFNASNPIDTYRKSELDNLVGTLYAAQLRYIQNVALMMFCEHPEKFFGYTYVQMTSFPKGSIENPSISEDFPNITGSVPQMIQATMERFRNLFIREKVIKVPNQMEALRIFNYPYQAIEEAVVNAFYHRDYMSYEPVTIEIEPDCINIMNFPGIDRSISEKTIAEGKRFVSRYYRNRRLGEFLKELDLSEGHSSGIPTIQEELEKNGSPRAEFFTDEDRRAMRIRIPIHPAFLENNDEISVSDGYEKATNKLSKKKMEQYDKILKLMDDGDWHKTAEIAENLGLKDTRTKELLKELVGLEKLVDNGKTKGKMYKLK